MDVFEAINKRRSVRKFKQDAPVSNDVVRKIIGAAILAPSAGNVQPWRFFVVRNEEIKRRIALEAGHQKFIDEVPVAIVVCADLESAEKGYGKRGRETYAIQDTAVAIENMMLAAIALGFSTCWVGAFNESVASEILGLPATLRPVAIIPVGVAANSTISMPPKKKVEDVTTFI